MVLKRSLNIFGKCVPVFKLDILSTQGNLGLFDPTEFKIILDPTLEGVEEQATELHELIHAVAERCGLTRTSIHDDLWEAICENISRAIVENYELKPLN